MPAFAAVQLMWEPGVMDAPGRLAAALESGGGVVLTPEEFLAALNPEFLIDWATPYLGAGHPAIVEAQTLLSEDSFRESLFVVREALKELPSRVWLGPPPGILSQSTRASSTEPMFP
jgi:hypothetical protein